jgi:allantoinase
MSYFLTRKFETMTLRAFTSNRVVLPAESGAFAVLADGEKIADVVPRNAVPPTAERLDFGDLTILPGLVDSHVHINEPGRTEWEGFRTATRAAAAGGYTLLVDMPLNCVPSTTSVYALQAKRAAAAGQCFVDWAAWGAVVPGNHEQLAHLAAAGVPGFKCFLIHPGTEDFAMVNEAQLRAALPRLKATNLPLLVHAELPGPIDSATESLREADWRSYATYLQSRPDSAELAAIDLLVKLSQEFGCHIHIVHLATASALEKLRDAKRRGLPITVETCPHYLHFSSDTIPDGSTVHKCAPPIRNRENREGLWQGLRDGTLDLVATDHSPCPPDMKKIELGDFRAAWGGISSLSLALPVMWTEAQRLGFALSNIAQWMAAGPAKLGGLDHKKGRLAPGYDADFVIFDPDAEWTVTPADLHFRHPISPYLGERLTGKVVTTYLRGDCIYEQGNFLGSPRGREYALTSDSRRNN